MPASTITRLQTPLQDFFLKKLSANYRRQGRVGDVSRGQRAFRARVFNTCGIILISANDNNVANHTIEAGAELGASFAATGGTPATGAFTGGTTFDVIDYAAASVVTPGIVPTVAPALVTATATNAQGKREVVVP